MADKQASSPETRLDTVAVAAHDLGDEATVDAILSEVDAEFFQFLTSVANVLPGDKYDILRGAALVLRSEQRQSQLSELEQQFSVTEPVV